MQQAFYFGAWVTGLALQGLHERDHGSSKVRQQTTGEREKDDIRHA